jgi:hypothetical protein
MAAAAVGIATATTIANMVKTIVIEVVVVAELIALL